jgi:hypothetical protein
VASERSYDTLLRSLTIARSGEATNGGKPHAASDKNQNSAIMIAKSVRHSIGLFVLAIASTLVAHAQVYTGAGTINLNSVSKSNFQIVTYCSIYNGSTYYTSVDLYLGAYSAHSDSNSGSADAYIYYHNVHKLSNGTWVAGDITIYELNSDYSWTTRVYYNVSISSSLSYGGIGYWGDAAQYQPYTIIN